MSKRIILATLAIFMSFSIPGHASDEHHHDHEHSNAASLSGLSLDNGKPWMMDEHTRKVSREMKTTFFEADHSKLKTLNTLGKKLDTQLQELIAGCTMTGPAHDQLHVFLNDHMPTIAALSKAENLKTARESAIKLKGQFESYQQYFQ
jgi:hypothetical protein